MGPITRDGLSACLLVLCFASWGTAAARADERPVCPEAPPAYTGGDEVRAEVHALREDTATVCAAARSDADTAHADAGAAHTDSAAVTAAVQASSSGTPGPAPGVDAAHPAHITVPSTVLDQAVDGFNAVHELLWFLSGLIVASLVAPHLRGLLRA